MSVPMQGFSCHGGLSWMDGEEQPCDTEGSLCFQQPQSVRWTCWGTSCGWMRKRPHSLSLTCPEGCVLSPWPPHPSERAAVLPWHWNPGEQARAGQEASLESGRTELIRTAQLGCCWTPVTPGAAQASSQHIPEGIPIPLTPLAPSQP